MLALLIFSLRAEVRAQSSPGSDPPAVAPSPSSAPQAPQHAKKIWTNENIGSIAGHGYAVPSGSSDPSRRDFRSHPFDGVSIDSPSAGTVVEPGEVLQIEVSASSDKDISGMVITSPLGFSNETRKSSPWSFTLNVPRDGAGISGPLIGAQPLYALFRRCGPDPNPKSPCYDGALPVASTEVDVEDPTPATKLWALLPAISFDGTIDVPLNVTISAVFTDGLDLEITRSTRISFSSTNPAVATVDENGQVTRTGVGKATIEVTYVGGGATTTLSIPVDSWIPRKPE